MTLQRKILVGLFVLLYIAVGLVSCYHAVRFFGVANKLWLAVILATAFEIGQAAILFSMLSDETQSRKVMPWILMVVLTAVQVIGNVVASYSYMMKHSAGEIQYFVDSIMFFVADPDPQVNTVILSYIIGAILPIVALGLTGMVVGLGESKPEPPKKSEEPSEPEIAETLFL